jgi:hypothetical protein
MGLVYATAKMQELLLHLKDRGGLKFREIAGLPDFAATQIICRSWRI